MKVLFDPYSAFVALTKFMLAATALGILLMLFVTARSTDVEVDLPVADVDIKGIAKLEGVSSPRYSAMMDNGDAILVNARTARPDLTRRERTLAQDVDALIETPLGREITVTSPVGEFNSKLDIADLLGGVHVVTSDGYNIVSEHMTAFIEEGRVESEADITITTDDWRIDAGRMILNEISSGDVTDYHVLFVNGVRVIYHPKDG